MTMPENSANILLNWFENAFTWLHEDGTQATTQRPHIQLLEQMEREKRTKRAWEYIEELEELTQTARPSERGEVMIRCAMMAAKLGNLKYALRLCQDAESKYATLNHQQAVTSWMIGCIHWETRQDVKAIAYWRSAINLLKERKDDLKIDEKTRKWYTRVIPRLEVYLARSISEEKLPVFTDDATLFRENRNTSQSSTAASNDKSVPFDSLKWIAVDIYESVPAGGFGPVSLDAENGNLEITEIAIGNQLYEVFCTKRHSLWKNSVVINPADKYHAIKVIGTSMNNSKPVLIEEGDYVLVRQHTNPEDNDIVIARTLDSDVSFTIKRLKKYPPNIIQLHPESKDDSHYQNPNFGRDLNPREVNIVGVVEAVFKKKTG